MKIIVLGGCGYVGTNLVCDLLNLGHKVKVIDNQWFGNYLIKNKNLINIKKDIRNTKIDDFKNYDCVVHLANIANDPSVELNPLLSWEVNVLSSYRIADFSARAGIKKFIYASSGSVYGVKKELKVHEELILNPISTYNKTKMVAERIFLSYKNSMKVYCIRPATVCGLSKRMRFDLTVNLLTLQAIKNKKITVFGGNQFRPTIHIKDLTNIYLHFLKKNIPQGIYNAGFENISIKSIAKKIQKKIDCSIIYLKSNDIRSYRLDSSKLISTNFKPNYDIDYAVDQIINKDHLGRLIVDDSCYTVKWMKKLKLNK
jgi:nucleoside-diphosphate-sugar epimerase